MTTENSTAAGSPFVRVYFDLPTHVNDQLIAAAKAKFMPKNRFIAEAVVEKIVREGAGARKGGKGKK